METIDLQSAGYAGNRLIEWVIRAIGGVVTWLVLQADLVALTIPKYVEILQEKYKADNVLLAPHGSFDDEMEEPSFELPDGPKQVMAFGKFGTYKKVEDMIEAVQLLNQRGSEPLEVVVAGTDSPNAHGYLAGVQEHYGHLDNLRFTGYVAESDVPRNLPGGRRCSLPLHQHNRQFRCAAPGGRLRQSRRPAPHRRFGRADRRRGLQRRILHTGQCGESG